ncbi:MFS transporter [Nocardioides limicola]|uniref:MFS transporter n=1 Tax=Nocardioides limicola TaxID=2803368 RepID=UPI00193C079D|nr:MFS transporter [Nocardioides sp. DJM-14]
MIRSPRLLLALAAVAVGFAAVDTYVVVLALPDMMGSAGIPIDELQRAAPIISGFLLGYVAMLPMIGRIADLQGRVPVLIASLLIFAVGSLVTALAYDLPSMVTGRFLQGVGGGGLVPATLALVADLYPVHRRGVPLGLVSAVQELGSVAGPLFGALVLSVAGWRTIFVINLVVGLVLAAAIRAGVGERRRSPRGPRARRPAAGSLLLPLALGAAVVTMVRPQALMRDVTWGQIFIPLAGESRWMTSVGLATLALTVAFVVRCLTGAHPLVDLRSWWGSLRAADLPGSLLLAVALGGVILAFSTADPEIEVFSEHGLAWLGVAGVGGVGLLLHLRRAKAPLVPRGALARTPAWGGLLVSFFVGAALIAALIDIPLFARTTAYPDSQLMAALVLLRFLVALPVGAVAGGFLLRVAPAGVVTGAGMFLSVIGFTMMSNWGLDALGHWSSDVALVLAGLGFGLALAPVNAAVLASTESAVHGLASALVVVARMVGMLVGISALTTLGLRRYYAAQSDLPPIREVCDGLSRCPEFTVLLQEAGIAQQQTVFAGAAVCCAVAGLLALILFRSARTRGLPAAETLRASG